MRTPLLLASLVLLALPLAGCGDSTGGSGSTGGGGEGTTSTDTATTTTGASTSTGSGADVESVDCAGATIAETITNTGATGFDPPTLTISAGDIIDFAPTGTHDMTADDDSWATGVGQGGCLKFNTAGSYPYHCSIHPSAMTGTVTVQ